MIILRKKFWWMEMWIFLTLTGYEHTMFSLKVLGPSLHTQRDMDNWSLKQIDTTAQTILHMRMFAVLVKTSMIECVVHYDV